SADGPFRRSESGGDAALSPTLLMEFQRPQPPPFPPIRGMRRIAHAGIVRAAELALFLQRSVEHKNAASWAVPEVASVPGSRQPRSQGSSERSSDLAPLLREPLPAGPTAVRRRGAERAVPVGVGDLGGECRDRGGPRRGAARGLAGGLTGPL